MVKIWNEKSINDLTKTSIQRDMLHAGLQEKSAAYVKGDSSD